MQWNILYSFLISIALGFLIGLERNISFHSQNEKGFAGSRTFAIISLLGYLSIYLNKYLPYIVYLSFFAIAILISTAYFLKIHIYHKQGSTTHFAAITTYLIGILVYFDKNLAIILTIITVFLLNIKTSLQKIENKLSNKDINAALLLLLMTFIILPILPDKIIYYINPYKTWMMAVIIASLSFLGYLAIKILGQKYGVLLTGAAGGFISSTAVTLSLGKMYSLYNNKTLLYTYASAISIANTIMFARVLVETLLINSKITVIISIPYILTTVTGIYYSYKLYKKSQIITDIYISKLEKNPLELNEAIKFAIIFGIIYSLTYLVSNKFGNIGIYTISFLSGITDVDAITLSLSSLAKNHISLMSASIGIAIASFTNSLVKLVIVWIFSSKDLAKEISKFFLTILLVFLISFIICYKFSN